MTEHSQQCLNKHAELKGIRDAYLVKYPNACLSCDATGQISWYESVDKYGGYWMGDICGKCVEQGKCPQCGEMVWNIDELDDVLNLLHCPKCNWSQTKHEGIPPDPNDVLYPCQCMADEEKKWEEELSKHPDWLY